MFSDRRTGECELPSAGGELDKTSAGCASGGRGWGGRR